MNRPLFAAVFALLAAWPLAAQSDCNHGLAIVPQAVRFGDFAPCDWAPGIQVGPRWYAFPRSSCPKYSEIIPEHQVLVGSPGSNQRGVLLTTKPISIRTFACRDTLFLGLFTMGVCTQTGSRVSGSVPDHALQECPVPAKPTR